VIKLAIAIKSTDTRQRFRESLVETACGIGSTVSDKTCEVMELNEETESVIECLKQYFTDNPKGMAVLISDWLVSTDAPNEKTILLRRCEAEFGKKLFGTIAIMPRPTRVLDIDRTVGSSCVSQCLARAVGMVVNRLNYLSIPSESPSDNSPVNVRPLKTTNQRELQDYFSLRHKVYTIMGYLDEEVENSRSKLELNEADLHAIHMGAFWRNGPREQLIGTARVVTNGAVDETLHETLTELVNDDPVAKQRLETPYPLGLPIFQSHTGMNGIIQEVFSKNQTCGELSRVIVAPQWRGRGISTRLIEAALRKSIAAGARRFFLECLAVHTSLYEKHGFRCISGIRGQVVDVGRTMVAMELRTEELDNLLNSNTQTPAAAYSEIRADH
jgi:predicted GNAT family N-acyltransferase